MSSQVHKAIVARWDAKSLDSTFDGGLWAFKAPLEETFPYVVFFPIADAPATWTVGREVRESTFQFSIWMKEADGVDPAKTLGELMDTLKAAYDFAPLTIAGQTVLLVQRDGETQEEEGDEIWHGTVTYRIRRSVAADYSPA